MVVTLAENGIKTRENLAELAGYELSGSEAEGEEGLLSAYGLTETDANEIITAARAHWFEGEEEDGADSDDAAPAEEKTES